MTVEEKANNMKTKPTEALKIIDENWDKGGTLNNLKIADIIACNVAFKEGQSNPKIKQLEWENVYSIHYVKDDNPIGYRAKISEWHISTTKYVLSFAHSGEINAKIYDTLEEAKAAAQSDFEARVKECLTTE